MTEEQRIVLKTSLKDVHDQIHFLYPKDNSLTMFDKQLRNQLLVVDLVVHLAEEAISGITPNKQQIAERAANLLYAIKLMAPDYPFEQAAKLLLDEKKAQTD
jgi:fumarate hydratase class II